MKVKVIGSGAAGNKAVICAIEDGSIERSSCLLVNSTDKDIPKEYLDLSCIIGNSNGAGKETKLGALMTEQALDNGQLKEKLQEFLEPDDVACIITYASEGGTGCGSAPVLSKFIRENTGIPVHEYPLMGFQVDARGMGNTVGLFKTFTPEYIVHSISNKKFLEVAKGNKIVAEQLANKLFSKQLRVITGSILVNGSQNIDETDHFKLINNPGYNMIESGIIPRDVKTQDQLNKILVDAIRNTKSIDIEQPVCKRFGIIWTINDEIKSIIDYSYQAIKDIVGEPYEVYEHIQAPKEDEEQSVIIILSGLKLPIKELQDIYNKYNEVSKKVDRTADSFYNNLNEMDINDDDEFNVQITPKSNFFKNKPIQQKVQTEDSMKSMLVRQHE